ncbi:hypothetical protein JCM13591A_18810 [Microbacterium xylanilyticum]
MPDEDDFSGRVVDGGDDGIDPVLQVDVCRVGCGDADTGHGEGLRIMARGTERFEHGRPGIGIEPQSGNKDELHGTTLSRAADIRHWGLLLGDPRRPPGGVRAAAG